MASGYGRLLLVVVPERVDELGDGDGVGVVRDQAQDEDAVLAEVPMNELAHRHLPIVVGLQLVDELEMPLDVLATAVAEREPRGPENERVERQRGDEQQPEVEEEEDLLVEEVDWQDALDVVAVDGTEPAHFEVAHGDAWKPSRREGRRLARRPIAADLRPTRTHTPD